MKVLSAMFSITIAVFCISCDEDQKPSPPNESSYPEARIRLTPDQMASANIVRATVGLPIIDNDWFLYRSRDNSDDWKMRKSDFIDKTVFFNPSGNVTNEENHYYSGSKYTDLEGEGVEYITVSYNYQNGQMAAYYAGTNIATKAIIAPVSMPFDYTTNFAQVMTAVRVAAKDWLHPVK